MGGKFLKIGVGILKRDTDPYVFVHTYPVLNEGKRGYSATKTSVRLTQELNDKETGWGYSYVKTVRLIPGKPQMPMEHVLKNTGTKEIVTSVYCHNFLSLSTGNENVELTAPFTLVAGKPLAADAASVNGKTLKYLRADQGRRKRHVALHRLRRLRQRLRLQGGEHQDRLRPAHPRRPAFVPDQFLVHPHHLQLGTLYRHLAQARRDQALDLYLRLFRPGRGLR